MVWPFVLPGHRSHGLPQPRAVLPVPVGDAPVPANSQFGDPSANGLAI